MVWTLPSKHKLRDYEELEEIDVFNEKSLKAHLKFITLVAKLSKAGMGSFPLIFFSMASQVDHMYSLRRKYLDPCPEIRIFCSYHDICMFIL